MQDFLKTATILYVEDDEGIREGYTRALKRYAKELYLAKDGQEGLEQYEKHRPDIIVSDIKMPRKNGIEMVQDIRRENPQQPVIFTTAHSESGYTLEALELQVDGYILKPVDKKVLRNKIEQISKSLQLEKENEKHQAILENVLSSQSSMTILTDFETISFASKSFMEFFHLESIEEFFERYGQVTDIFIRHREYINGGTKEEFLKQYSATGEDNRVVSLIDGDFAAKAFKITINTIELEGRELYVLNLTDISKMQEKKIQAEHKAFYDGLTGVCNRNKFEEVFQAEFARAQRFGHPLSIAILDIDHFKNFNDTYGHLIGDEVLIALAKLIESHTRKEDCFARWGGEEFVLLAVEADLERAQKICEHLRTQVHTIDHEIAGGITCSFGVTQLQADDTLETIFKRCDDALYKARENGRDRVESA